MEAPWQIAGPKSFFMVMIIFSTSNTMGNRPSWTILMKVVNMQLIEQKHDYFQDLALMTSLPVNRSWASDFVKLIRNVYTRLYSKIEFYMYEIGTKFEMIIK